MLANSTYPLATLSSVLKLDIDLVPVTPSETFPMSGIYSFGKGIFKRSDLSGADTSYKKMHRLQNGKLVVSQLKAWEGAIALIDESHDGRFLSPQFPTFSAIEDLLEIRYVSWYCKLPSVWKSLQRSAKGIGARRDSVSPERFLNLKIPLPSLKTQHAIVELLQSAHEKIKLCSDECLLRRADLEAIMISMAHRYDLSDSQKEQLGWKKVQMGNALKQRINSISVEQKGIYPHFGIYSFAKGLFAKQPLRGDEIKATKLYRVHSGQFIYARLNAYEGAMGIVTEEFDQHYVSNEFPAFDCDEKIVLPEFLMAYFQSSKTWEDMKKRVTGIGGGAGNRRIRLKENIFLSQAIWLPPMSYQLKPESVGS